MAKKSASPYSGLPPRAFWRSGVQERSPLDPGDIYTPRFPVTRDMKIATAGSCFAQHVGRALRGAGLDVLDAEPLPAAVDDATANKYGYRLYSARYGNIYTARQLRQLWEEANGEFTPAEPVWEHKGRYFDALRPSVEPEGLPDVEAVRGHRAGHLRAVMEAYSAADLFVFTFGLTEAWIHTETGTVYPTAPGTIAGQFDPERWSFKNYDVVEILEDFETFRSALKTVNPNVKFLITVSPVPLTATASGQHVEVATCYSKSVLRAVCGMLLERHDDIDYFPSFELITSLNARGVYYEPNQRNVSSQGVNTAMSTFLNAHGLTPKNPSAKEDTDEGEEVVCEEILLEAFAR
ncbi:GSCFA domain-containing protein [Amaricoccus tamworthensis]|uniref:GSCFA domain-containing protein n=1 Tax=Amaricoccus tamworthensis TaxID=57002 RepID=UPI003C7A9354